MKVFSPKASALPPVRAVLPLMLVLELILFVLLFTVLVFRVKKMEASPFPTPPLTEDSLERFSRLRKVSNIHEIIYPHCYLFKQICFSHQQH